jgi:hypothetical protein
LRYLELNILKVRTRIRSEKAIEFEVKRGFQEDLNILYILYTRIHLQMPTSGINSPRPKPLYSILSDKALGKYIIHHIPEILNNYRQVYHMTTCIAPIIPIT